MKMQLVVDNLAPKIDVVNGRPTPVEERDKAYAYWAWQCNRNTTLAATRLGIDRNTIASWARQDDWALRWEQESADTSPQSQRMLAFLHLGNNVYRAATVATELMGSTVQEYAEELIEAIEQAGGASVDPDQLRAIVISVLAGNHQLQKVRLTAAHDIMDRCAISVEAGLRLIPPPTIEEPPAVDLTDEELFDQL